MQAQLASASCPRILLRAQKKTRRIRKWESLPSLQLPPRDRLLFFCVRCHFANSLAAVCPWCFSVCYCDTTSRARPRRRVSSPTLLSNPQKALLNRIEERSAGTCYDYLMNIVAHPTIPPAEERRRRRHGMIYSAGDVAAGVSKHPELRTFADQLVPLHEERACDEDPVLPPLSARTTNAIHAESPAPLASASPCRSLRRKRSRLRLRQRSSGTLRTRASKCDLVSAEPSHALPPRPVSPTSVSVLSHASASVGVQDGPRLPYMAMRRSTVTARRTQSPERSSSPTSTAATARTAKSLDYPRSPMDAARESWTPCSPRPFSVVSSAGSFKTGYSASGLAELRIELSRVPAPESQGTYRYSFREPESPMKRKVRSLGAGLKDLLTRKGGRAVEGDPQ